MTNTVITITFLLQSVLNFNNFLRCSSLPSANNNNNNNNNNETLTKNIFILWLQGWENAKWLNKKVAESWVVNNKGWTVHYIDFNNLKNYVSDIDYIYDSKKDISDPAKSDIIRLSLLRNHGGVWADATMVVLLFLFVVVVVFSSIFFSM